jgi:hypothetical protein
MHWPRRTDDHDEGRKQSFMQSRPTMHHIRIASGLIIAMLLGAAAQADDAVKEMAEEAWNAHVQTTYIWQQKAAMNAPYSGLNSLRAQAGKSYSFSATAALGWRAWAGGELYLNPELVQGVPLSNLSGLGGMSNGERQKTGGPNLTLYRARFFLRQTWSLGGEKEGVESDFNQLAGMLDRRRIVVSVGNLALNDLFDNNAFAHDGRTQFMNWALMTHGAFAGQAGKLRALVFRNRANMGGFRTAIDDASQNGGDALGMALAMNGLSNAHRDYLAAGGRGAFLGDGRLHYGSESMLETYHSLVLGKHAALTLDYQRIVHPGYNRDRGPVDIGAVRLHAQY